MNGLSTGELVRDAAVQVRVPLDLQKVGAVAEDLRDLKHFVPVKLDVVACRRTVGMKPGLLEDLAGELHDGDVAVEPEQLREFPGLVLVQAWSASDCEGDCGHGSEPTPADRVRSSLLDDEHGELIFGIGLGLNHVHDAETSAGALRDDVAGLHVGDRESDGAEGFGSRRVNESEAEHEARGYLGAPSFRAPQSDTGT